MSNPRIPRECSILSIAHRTLLLLATVLVVVGCQSSSSTPVEDADVAVESWPILDSAVKPDPAVEARIDGLMAEMSLEQKISQMIQGEIKWVEPADLSRYQLGSILNGGGSYPGQDRAATVASSFTRPW